VSEGRWLCHSPNRCPLGDKVSVVIVDLTLPYNLTEVVDVESKAVCVWGQVSVYLRMSCRCKIAPRIR